METNLESSEPLSPIESLESSPPMSDLDATVTQCSPPVRCTGLFKWSDIPQVNSKLKQQMQAIEEEEAAKGMELLSKRNTIGNIIYFDIQLRLSEIYEKYISMLEGFNSDDKNIMNERGQILAALNLNMESCEIPDENEIQNIMERALYLIMGLNHPNRLDDPTFSV